MPCHLYLPCQPEPLARLQLHDTAWLQAATMTSRQDVMAAADAFHGASASLGCVNAALPLTRKQAREEMKGVPRYPARYSPVVIGMLGALTAHQPATK